MRKYFAILSTQIQNSFQYRGQLFFWVINETLFLVVLFFVWQAIFREQELVGQYTFSTLITYYVTVFLVEMIASSYNEYNMESIVRDGKLNKYLIRPMSFFWYRALSDIGWKVSKLIVTLPVYLFVLYVLRSFLVLPESGQIIYFLAVLATASVLYFLISYLISFFAFWMLKISSIINILRATLIPLLAGALIPLDLFPQLVRRITDFLPFKYLIFFPVQVFLGNISDFEILTGLLISLAWIAALGVSCWALWFPALKKYESVGG